MADLLTKTANPIIIVRFATFEPKILPTANPASPLIAASDETESSGREVTSESKIKPAATSDRPNPLEITSTYLITLSLKMPIKTKEISRINIFRIVCYHLNTTS